MIQNKVIFAEYFSSSKSVVFNQKANMDKIDILINKYDEWEVNRLEKKIEEYKSTI